MPPWTTRPHSDKTRRINARGLKFYARAFRALGLEFVRSSANFILVKVGEGQRVFLELQKLGVIVRPMAGYQLPEVDPHLHRHPQREPEVPRSA